MHGFNYFSIHSLTDLKHAIKSTVSPIRKVRALGSYQQVTHKSTLTRLLTSSTMLLAISPL